MIAQLVAIAALVGCAGGAVATSVGRGGPVADYERLAGVVLHQQTDEMAPELRPLLTQLLGRSLHVATWEAASPDPDDPDEPDHSLRWVRDYHPIYARDRRGALFAIRYLSENPNRSEFDARRRPGMAWLPGRDGGTWVRRAESRSSTRTGTSWWSGASSS